LNEENVIVDAPGVSNTKIVASQTKHRPYFVEYGYKNGKITCECAMYKGSEFCSHALAVACSLNLTSNFLQWRTKKKVDLNLTALVKWDAENKQKKSESDYKCCKLEIYKLTPSFRNSRLSSSERLCWVVWSITRSFTLKSGNLLVTHSL
jgi:hypothetical protein